MHPGRLAAAFAAAAGLHLAVFHIWPALPPLSLAPDEGGELRIELVKHQVRAKPIAEIERSEPRKPRMEHREHIAPTAPPKLAEQPLPRSNSMKQESKKSAYAATPETAARPGTVPAEVQQMILTNISYPRQARRKGWQGKATFHLDVREQKLAKLDLFHSSGYELLDQAAMRGIRAINLLPLDNGLYRLPVEFHLQ